MVVGDGAWARLLREPKSLGCLVMVESLAYRNTRWSFRGPILEKSLARESNFNSTAAGKNLWGSLTADERILAFVRSS